jgi:two-component system alkaline phosphatase synthesis response regulator PhoP
MSKKILVVDDEPTALRLAKFILERAGFQVISAVNGIEAVKKAIEEKPDLVILDVMMPGMDGYDVCRQIRKDLALVTAPVLMLTAQARDEDRDEAMKAGATDYLSKPVDPSAFLSRVKSMLGA